MLTSVFVLVAVAITWALFPLNRPVSNPKGPNGLIVALGDSYISGEGAKHYEAGTNTRSQFKDGANYNQCRRSPDAYAPKVALERNMTLVFVACSGASVDNILTVGQYRGEGVDKSEKPMSQLALVDKELPVVNSRQAVPDWVLVSIGGNDAGFGNVVKSCLSPGNCAELASQWNGALEGLRFKLAALYDELHRRVGRQGGRGAVPDAAE